MAGKDTSTGVTVGGGVAIIGKAGGGMTAIGVVVVLIIGEIGGGGGKTDGVTVEIGVV